MCTIEFLAHSVTDYTHTQKYSDEDFLVFDLILASDVYRTTRRLILLMNVQTRAAPSSKTRTQLVARWSPVTALLDSVLRAPPKEPGAKRLSRVLDGGDRQISC